MFLPEDLHILYAGNGPQICVQDQSHACICVEEHMHEHTHLNWPFAPSGLFKALQSSRSLLSGRQLRWSMTKPCLLLCSTRFTSLYLDLCITWSLACTHLRILLNILACLLLVCFWSWPESCLCFCLLNLYLHCPTTADLCPPAHIPVLYSHNHCDDILLFSFCFTEWSSFEGEGEGEGGGFSTVWPLPGTWQMFIYQWLMGEFSTCFLNQWVVPQENPGVEHFERHSVNPRHIN